MGTHKNEALTDEILAKARKKKGKFKLTDGNGLVIDFNNPNGNPAWALKFRHEHKFIGKRLGKWPEMSLAQARVACANARKEWEAKNVPGAAHVAKPAPYSGPKPAAPQARVIKQVIHSQQSVFAAAGAAMELIEAFGFEWNGIRWIHRSYLP